MVSAHRVHAQHPAAGCCPPGGWVGRAGPAHLTDWPGRLGSRLVGGWGAREWCFKSLWSGWTWWFAKAHWDKLGKVYQWRRSPHFTKTWSNMLACPTLPPGRIQARLTGGWDALGQLAWPTHQAGNTLPQGTARVHSGQRPISLEHQIYLLAIDTLITGMEPKTKCLFATFILLLQSSCWLPWSKVRAES